MGTSIVYEPSTRRYGTIIRQEGKLWAVECLEDGQFLRHLWDFGFDDPKHAEEHLAAGLKL